MEAGIPLKLCRSIELSQLDFIAQGCSEGVQTKADNQEIGRATSDVQFVQDDAQYIAFTFPPDMDRQTVKVYKITARFPEAESSQ